MSEVYAPDDGEIVEINAKLADDPGLFNTDPLGAGWLYRIRVTGVPGTLSEAEYEALIAGTD